MKFMGLEIKAMGLEDKPQKDAGFASWAQIASPKQGDPIKIVIMAPEDAFAIFESRPHPMGEEGFTFSVPVRWTNNGPSTRQKGVDNVDIILLDSGIRHFLDIQVGVVVRSGRFFLTAQKIWQGWITGSLMEDIKFIPSAPEHAYPGSDYASIWRGMSQVMVFVWSLIKDLGEVPDEMKPAVWTPQPRLIIGDMTTGVVIYFNMITGTGSLLLEDSSRQFVHFSSIEDEIYGPMRVLVPMSAVRVFLTEDPKTHKLTVSKCVPVAA